MSWKAILKYWVPPLAWMAFIFPIGNKIASSSRTYEIAVAVFRWMLPHASSETIGFLYIVLRKSFHFIEYALLAYLLYRAFRGMSQKAWDWRWVVFAGMISVEYGALDELIQSFMNSRNGSIVDVAVDFTGVMFVVMMVLLRRNKIKRNTLGVKSGT